MCHLSDPNLDYRDTRSQSQCKADELSQPKQKINEHPVKKRHYLMPEDIVELQNKILNILKTVEVTPDMKYAYERLYHALVSLSVYERYQIEVLGKGCKTPETIMPNINVGDSADLVMLASICYERNEIIKVVYPDISAKLYDDIRKAAMILAYFGNRLPKTFRCFRSECPDGNYRVCSRDKRNTHHTTVETSSVCNICEK